MTCVVLCGKCASIWVFVFIWLLLFFYFCAECCNEELLVCLDHASIPILSEWFNGTADWLTQSSTGNSKREQLFYFPFMLAVKFEEKLNFPEPISVELRTSQHFPDLPDFLRLWPWLMKKLNKPHINIIVKINLHKRYIFQLPYQMNLRI